MTSAHRHPPHAGARAAVLQAAAAARASGGLLPPIDMLAAQAGVSRMTAWKALLELCSESEIRRLDGRRGFAPAGGAAKTTVAVSHSESRHEHIAHAIVGDLVTGCFDPHEPLPPYKTLIHRYGACYGVLRTALESLVEKGTLVRYRRGYRRFPLRAPRSGSSIAVIAGTTDMRQLCAVGTRTTDLWRSLEREAMRLGVSVVFLRLISGCRLRAADGRCYQSMHAAERSLSLLGYIILPLGMTVRQRRGLGTVVAAARAPAAVLEEDSQPLRLNPGTGRRHVQSFALGFGQLPGYIVGKRLLELGHRDVAFLCLSERDVAFRERFAGMRAAFDELGIADRLYPVTSRRWRKGVAALHRPVRQSPALQVLHDAAEVAERICRSPGRCSAPRGAAGNALTESHRAYVRTRHYENESQIIFAQALEHSDITAWVTINDELALMALRYLRHHRVSVPERISVVGFDDSVDAFGAGLSSYDFNVSGVVRAMLEHIVARRQMPGLRQSERGWETPGALIERRSLRTR